MLVAVSFAWAQSAQEVEYGVLRAGAGSWSWTTAAGAYTDMSPDLMYARLTNASIPEVTPQGAVWEERILNHLASWGWRVVAAVPLADGGAQYLLERACGFEPSGCYAGE